MAGEVIVTLVGNLTADPELRFTPSGAAVCNFTVASTPRNFDRQSQEWKDGEALFMRCNAWRQLAENVSEGLRRGDRVVVVGRLKQRSFDTKEGEKRTVVECEADEVAASAKFAMVTATKAQRRHSEDRGGFPAPSADDPWATAPAGSGGFGGDGPNF